jgi:hypothetical protein
VSQQPMPLLVTNFPNLILVLMLETDVMRTTSYHQLIRTLRFK